MKSYEDLMILPHHTETMLMHCAVCGNLLRVVPIKEESRDYYYCKKCKVVRWYAQYR